MFDHEQATEHLNFDLKLIDEWSLKWKMIFNPDVNKPAEEYIFTNGNVTPYATSTFGNAGVTRVDLRKHLGLILDSKLTFNIHLDEKIAKANKGIGIIRRLYCYLPRSVLMQIHKSYIRPNHKPTYDEFTREYTLERAFPDPVNINDQFSNKI